jgi:dTDP-4-amino-4,6-dideoxygalactose transaminase
MSVLPKIPFNRPFKSGAEFDAMRAAFDARHISGNGRFTRQAETLLSQILAQPTPGVLLTTSCTHALEMAAILLDLQPGDEVILPSYTFVSTANAFVLRGARPRFIDIRPDTLNLDETLLQPLINERTRAIVPVHYAGIACEMHSLLETAARHHLAVIEDNAHGLFGTYHARQLGTFGSMAALSFHETKNISCGEGGALILNDPSLCHRAEILREKGTNRSQFFRGEVDKYSWVDVGSSYVMSDMLAAFLAVQLENRTIIQTHRQRVWETYHAALLPHAPHWGVTLPTIPPGCGQAYHLFYLLLPDASTRNALMDHLRSAGISAVFHYLPLHLSTMGVRYGGKPGDLPVTEDLSARLLRLPFYPELTSEDQDRIVREISRFFGSGNS